MVARQKIQHLWSAAGNESGTLVPLDKIVHYAPNTQNVSFLYFVALYLEFRGLYTGRKNSFCGLRSKIRYCAPREEKTWAGHILSTLPHEQKAKVANTRYGLANFTAVEPIFFITPGPKMPHSRSWAGIESGTFGEDMVTKFLLY